MKEAISFHDLNFSNNIDVQPFLQDSSCMLMVILQKRIPHPRQTRIAPMIDCTPEGIWQEAIEIICCGETVQAETRWICLSFMFRSITDAVMADLQFVMSISISKKQVINNESREHLITEIKVRQQWLKKKRAEENRDYHHALRNPYHLHLIFIKYDPE